MLVFAIAAGDETHAGTAPGGDEGFRRVHAAGTYLVVGSFRQYEHAAALVRKLTEFPTAISIGVVENKVWFRAVAGPFGEGDLAAARERFAAAGIPDAWRIRLCADGLSTPPCAAP